MKKFVHAFVRNQTDQSLTLPLTDAVVQKCSIKKLFLKISQNSLENTCATDFLGHLFLQNTSGGCFCTYIQSKTQIQFCLRLSQDYVVDFSDMFISFAIYNNIILCKPAIAVAHIMTKLLGLTCFRRQQFTRCSINQFF